LTWQFNWLAAQVLSDGVFGKSPLCPEAGLALKSDPKKKLVPPSTEGVENMKNGSLVRMAFAAVTATAICFGASMSLESAQNIPTAGDTIPPSARPAQAPPLADGVSEVVKMYQGGVEKEVILDYIGNTGLSCHLNADAILYLKSLGAPPEIARAMIQRDGVLRQQQQNYRPPQPMLASYDSRQFMPAPGGYFGNQSPDPMMDSAGMDGWDYPGYGGGYGYGFYGGPFRYWSPRASARETQFALRDATSLNRAAIAQDRAVAAETPGAEAGKINTKPSGAPAPIPVQAPVHGGGRR
jgi:hypothetical protein